MAIRLTVPWKPGQLRPTKLQQVYLHRIARMVELNEQIVLAVYNRARIAPTTSRTRNQYEVGPGRCSTRSGTTRISGTRPNLRGCATTTPI